MSVRIISCFVVLGSILAAGCSGGKRGGHDAITDSEVAAKQAALNDIHDAIEAYFKNTQKPPKQVADLKPYQAQYTIGIPALQRGDYVAVWGVAPKKGSSAVLAYDKDAPKSGGV